jgi:hypothetical protein
MHSLHSVLRSIRGETQARPDHLTIFREFLGHLDRIGRRNGDSMRPAAQPKRRGRRSRK